MLRAVDSFHREAEYGQRPDNPKDRPAPRTPHHAEGKRSVSPGNQQKDRAMIDYAKDSLSAVVWNRMVERRGEIQQNHRRGKDADADDVPCRTRTRSRNNQNGSSRNGQ